VTISGAAIFNTTLGVAGTTSFSGAAEFKSTVLLAQDPTLSLQAVTKQYADSISFTSPLTTKGDLYTYTTVDARLAVAVGDGKILQVLAGAATGLAYSTPTYPSASGTAGFILRSDGTNNVYSQTTYPDIVAASAILYGNGANNVSALATANNGLPVTGNTGVPSILAGPGTTRNLLQSNAAAAPSFTTETWAAPGTTGNILTSDGTNWTSAVPTPASGFEASLLLMGG